MKSRIISSMRRPRKEDGVVAAGVEARDEEAEGEMPPVGVGAERPCRAARLERMLEEEGWPRLRALPPRPPRPPRVKAEGRGEGSAGRPAAPNVPVQVGVPAGMARASSMLLLSC